MTVHQGKLGGGDAEVDFLSIPDTESEYDYNLEEDFFIPIIIGKLLDYVVRSSPKDFHFENYKPLNLRAITFCNLEELNALGMNETEDVSEADMNEIDSSIEEHEEVKVFQKMLAHAQISFIT